MRNINFPSYKFRIKNSENNTHIFDVIRKKFVVLQPEEWVRQHCIQFLINEKNFPVNVVKVTIVGKLTQISICQCTLLILILALLL